MMRCDRPVPCARAMLLLKACAIGFAIAAPVGPIGLLCIQRTLAGGWTSGLASGLGAAAADAVYGALAGLGVAALARVLVAQSVWLGLAGGALLVVLGIGAMRAPASRAARGAEVGRIAAFASTFVLTLANPMTILSFVAVFASLGADATASTAAALAVVAGVFLGSAAWWLLLAAAVEGLRARLGPAALGGINRAAGAAVILLGLWSMLGAIRA